jgi:Protein of unknown function (DUF2637)
VQLPQLRRIRWAVRAALTLGVAASVAANVLHARPNPISQAIAAWPPLALLLTVELTSRIPMHRRSLAACRVFSTIAIAAIAAWVSYWHMASVAARYGETDSSAYLLPISVDGLIVVASVSLVELAGRIRRIEDQRANAALAAAAQRAAAPQPSFTPPPVRFVEPVPSAMPTPAPLAQPVPAAQSTDHDNVRDTTAPNLDDVDALDEIEALAGQENAPVSPAIPPVRPDARSQAEATTRSTSTFANLGVGSAVATPRNGHVNGSTPPPKRSSTRAAVSIPTRTVVTSTTRKAVDTSAPKPRRPAPETADLAAEIEALNPGITQAEVAEKLGISVARLRQAKRDARDSEGAGARR